jgi:hypothetical protein
MDIEIRFKAYLQSPGNNVARKRLNFFKTIKSIKEIAYRDHIRSMVTMKHNRKDFFGYAITNFYLKNKGDDEDTN